MPSFKLVIVANNEAGSWASWPDKIAQIKAFYAPVCDLGIVLVKSTLTPQFSPYASTSGNWTIYQVNREWYEANVDLLATGANIVMLIVPPSDHTVPTLGGFEAGYADNVWETTVFSDETSHNYIGVNGQEVNQGENFVVVACHELSHAFYAMLRKTDNTHLYFYSGQPTKVLDEFDFNEELLSWYQKLIPALEDWIGILKSRAPIIEPPATVVSAVQNATLSASSNQSMSETSFPAKIVAWAKIIGQEEGANPALNNPGNLGYSTLTASWGAIRGPAKTDGGNLAQFATSAIGHTALCNFLTLGCENELLAFHQARTLGEFTDVYANHPPAGYKNAIVSAMGGDPNVKISTFLS